MVIPKDQMSAKLLYLIHTNDAFLPMSLTGYDAVSIHLALQVAYADLVTLIWAGGTFQHAHCANMWILASAYMLPLA